MKTTAGKSISLRIVVSVAIMLTGLTLYLNGLEYEYPKTSELNKRMNYFERMVEEPTDSSSELFEMGNENPEWMLFSLSFSSYAFTNIVMRDSTNLIRAEKYIDKAIQICMQKLVSRYFGSDDPFHPEIDSTLSVLYAGHLNMMLGCYRMISENKKYDGLNDSLSESLFIRFNKSKSKCLESYSNSIWIPDNTVALASLKINDDVNGNNRYENYCEEWIRYAKRNYSDSTNGLLYSTINYETGLKAEEPRGSMLGWSILFIEKFDREYAETLYENYKNYFSSNFLMFRLFKERMNDYRTGEGDVDSGPLILGYSIPANAWALGSAVYFGDKKTARKLQRLISVGSKKVETDSEIKYDLRIGKMRISPMAEALLLYMETMTEWRKRE